MKRFFLWSAVIFSSLGSLKSNCIFKVKVVSSSGHKASEIIVLNFENTAAIYQNDSVAIYSFSPSIPTNAIILLNRSERWHTFAWMEPKQDTVELIVNFETKNTVLKRPKKWDLVFQEYNTYFDNEDYFKADKFAESYIDKNPNSYLSLWLLSHGAAFHNKTLKAKLFNELGDNLKVYKEYQEIEKDLKNRRVPKTGQSFKEFTLSSIEQKIFNSNSINNKIIILHFWSNSCGACIRGIDELSAFNSTLDTSKIKLISISFDESKETWLRSKSAKKLTWTNLWEPNGVYCDLCLYYDLNVMPLFVVFNRDKKLSRIIEGEDIKSIQAEISNL